MSRATTSSATARHPRDGFVLYQEYIQRLNEGDEVDTSAEQKVRVDLQHLGETSSTATMTFWHEDHTVGNPLRHVMMQREEVVSAGYSIPHPLEPKMIVHVQADDYAVDVVAKGLTRLAEICDDTLRSFETALQTAHIDGA